MRDRLIRKLADLAVDKTAGVMWTIVVVTLVLGALSSRLGMTPKWSDMLPEGDKRTVEFDRILEEFQSASSIVVVAQGPESDIKAFAEDLAPRLTKPLTIPGKDKDPHVYVRRVDYKIDVDFMKSHGFMLMKNNDLENMKDIFQDPGLTGLLTNINNGFEKEYIQPDESVSNREEEDAALVFLDGINSWLEKMEIALGDQALTEREVQAAVDKLLLGEPYFLSYDKQALILNVNPTFSAVDTYLMVDGTDAVQAVVDDVLKAHPTVQAGLTGMIPMGRDEMVYGTQGLEVSSLLSMLMIGALLFMAFRMWVAPLLALVNLVIGLIWAAGLVALVVPVLNIMTAMFIVILLGLGIDFSIHVISAFTEIRARGASLADAIHEGLMKSGRGVSTGAFTTAIAFLAMIIGDSRAMSELGLVTAVGLLAVMVSTFTALPTFLVIRERRHEKKLEAKGDTDTREKKDLSFAFMGKLGTAMQTHPILTLSGVVLVSLVMFMAAMNISFNYNYLELEPEGIPSITLQDTVVDKFDLSMDFAYLVTESVEETRRLNKMAKDLPSVATVEDISLYLPSETEQANRRPHVDEIRDMMTKAKVKPLRTGDLNQVRAEVERLEMNMMEFQSLAFLGGQDKVLNRCNQIVGSMEGAVGKTIFSRLHDLLDNEGHQLAARLDNFQKMYAGYFSESIIQMANSEPISLASLPESIVDRYANKDRTLFLTTVLPTGNIWQDIKFLNAFTDDLDTISERTTGMPPVFRALIDIIARDGTRASYITVALIFVLLVIDFRRLGIALIALLPLATGGLWMLGIMSLVGKQLDVINIMALPLILGIGIDDGVHVVHRWLLEGKRSAHIVFASTGKAILLTSLTTMVAFGSMMFSAYRGYASLAWALLIGVGACFLATITILPAIMGLMDGAKQPEDKS